MRLLNALIDTPQLTGIIAEDVPVFLRHHGLPKTAVHCAEVAAEAQRLANRFGADVASAGVAGWLHDISAVFPAKDRADIARQLGVPVLPEEDYFPMIIHQKLSVVIAREVFGVNDAATLSAVGCHTTLRQNASLLDKIVFFADKIAWDQPGEPPYLESLTAALDNSISQAAFVYLEYLWQMCAQLKVLHPWAADAYRQLKVWHEKGK